MNWLILTTRDLPEAGVMADFLLRKAQDVVVLNVRGRTRAQSFAVLKRLARKRGAGYLADFLLGRALRGRVLDPAAQPFPEITAAARAALRRVAAISTWTIPMRRKRSRAWRNSGRITCCFSARR